MSVNFPNKLTKARQEENSNFFCYFQPQSRPDLVLARKCGLCGIVSAGSSFVSLLGFPRVLRTVGFVLSAYRGRGIARGSSVHAVLDRYGYTFRLKACLVGAAGLGLCSLHFEY